MTQHPKPKTQHLLLAATAVGLVTLPKAFHIDDTFVLQVTQNILIDPLRPFAGQIDWFGHFRPVWEATTNPPLLSYLLAPLVALFGYSEPVLHLLMAGFVILLAWALGRLGGRFTGSILLPSLFVLLSCGIVVSVNVMRDVPAAALMTAGIALMIEGTDHHSHRHAALGSFLCGLAILFKYSMIISVPLLLLYPLLKRRFSYAGWAALPVFILGLWCLQNWIVEGRLHVAYLLLERNPGSRLFWQDRFWGGIAITGSLIYLFPVLLWHAGRRRWWPGLAAVLMAAGGSIWGSLAYYKGDFDIQFLLWTAAGSILLAFALIEGLRTGLPAVRRFFSGRGAETDSLFLVAWLCAPLLFSVLFVPFQAVRHLLPALPPLVLLCFRFLATGSEDKHRYRPALLALLVIQSLLAGLIALSDYQYADSYRDFAGQVRHRLVNEPGRIWYVGHWGWMFYAEESGFAQLHRDGPLPPAGDWLLWPRYVHVGDVFQERAAFVESLVLEEELPYPNHLPVTVMNSAGRASFYAVVQRRIPYRFLTGFPHETMRIYRVPD